jgi:hypothetical protein
VGGDFSLERFFQNSRDATAYIDGGVDGVSVFRWNEVLTGEVISLRTPQVQFVTIASPPVPMSKEDCKHGGWKTLVDGDSRPFKNQGQCIHFVKRTSYTHHHKHGRDCGDPDERDDDDRRHD